MYDLNKTAPYAKFTPQIINFRRQIRHDGRIVVWMPKGKEWPTILGSLLSPVKIKKKILTLTIIVTP